MAATLDRVRPLLTAEEAWQRVTVSRQMVSASQQDECVPRAGKSALRPLEVTQAQGLRGRSAGTVRLDGSGQALARLQCFEAVDSPPHACV